jgi:trimeric autotransporter adhesin
MKHVTFHLPSFLRRVRIHGGEFDSSARAMNREKQVRLLQADLRIVRGSTIERKQMSTTIKRIALVAVAALGLGVLSVAPSQAAVQDLTVTVTANGTPTLSSQDTRTAAAFTVAGLLDAGTADTVSVTVIQKTIPAGAATPTLLLGFVETTTAATKADDTATGIFAAQLAKHESTTGGITLSAAGVAYVGAKFTAQFETGTATLAGTYTYTVIAKPFTSGVAGVAKTADLTLTIAAAAVVVPGAPVASKAKAYIQAMNTYPTGTVLADSATSGSFVAGTQVGTIRLSNIGATDAAAFDTITVAMTGVGYVKIAGSTTQGRNFVVPNEDVLDLEIFADGTSGTGTITLTTVAGASFVKTATFFDTKPSKAVATAAKAYIKAGTGEVAEVFSVVVTDVLGNPVTNATITAAATDTATTVGGAASCGTYDATDKVYYCAVKGLSATKFGPVAYTIKATGADTAKTVVSASATVTFADVVATKAVLAGPATGTPGATVEYTITLTEKNGYPVADEIYGAGVEATGGDLFSKAVVSGWTTAPFAATESWTSVSGVITSKGILPIAGVATGTWTLAGDGLQTLAGDAIDKTIGKTTLTVSTDVANPGVDAATDAANEATDAANAATDAALAAAEAADAATTAAQEASDAVAALSASVTKLIEGLQAQIKSLAAVVAKIAKKVKA